MASDRTDWRTPAPVLGRVRGLFGGAIDLDPCGGPGSIVGAAREYAGQCGCWHFAAQHVTVGGVSRCGAAKPGGEPCDCEGLNIRPEDNGLLHPWAPRTYVNPPYGREIGQWVAKCGQEAASGHEVLLLVPARVDTAWWRRGVLGELDGEALEADKPAQVSASAVCFWAGRLKFGLPEGAAEHGATFPAAVIWYSPRVDDFARAFGSAGWIVPAKRRLVAA